MRKLYIISRDGKAANDFIMEHNLNKEDVVIVKLARDLNFAIEDDNYVVLSSVMPNNYHWRLRPLLIKKKMRNVTKFYTNKLINF